MTFNAAFLQNQNVPVIYCYCSAFSVHHGLLQGHIFLSITNFPSEGRRAVCEKKKSRVLGLVSLAKQKCRSLLRMQGKRACSVGLLN